MNRVTYVIKGNHNEMFYEKIVLPIFVLIKAPNGLLAATHVDMDANRYTIGIFGGNPHLLSNQQVYNP